MADYRIYVVGSDGHFINVVAIECADDAEATKRAAHLVDGHDVELWQRARKVASLPHKTDTP
jgi:hypothetical protein